MNYCQWCHKDLGERGSQSRHRRDCDFAPGTPWGSWSVRFLSWTKRSEHMQGEAYANLSRILFYRLAPNTERGGYVADQHRQLRSNVAEGKDAELELKKLMNDTPQSALGQYGAERLRSLKTSAFILESRLDEIESMRRYLEER